MSLSYLYNKMAQRYNNSAGHTNKFFVYAVMRVCVDLPWKNPGAPLTSKLERKVEKFSHHIIRMR